MGDRTSVGTGVVIIDGQGQVLLVKDRVAKRGGKEQKWGIVGGILEDNLTFEENAMKEVLEETGYTVKLTAVSGIYQHVDDRYNRISIIFTASPLAKEAKEQVDEIADLRWFKPEDIPYPDLRFPHNEQMIKDALALGADASDWKAPLKTVRAPAVKPQ